MKIIIFKKKSEYRVISSTDLIYLLHVARTNKLSMEKYHQIRKSSSVLDATVYSVCGLFLNHLLNYTNFYQSWVRAQENTEFTGYWKFIHNNEQMNKRTL